MENKKPKEEDLPGEPQLYDFRGRKPEGGGVMLQTKPRRTSRDKIDTIIG